ncbi:MAG: hypothetical protein HYZ69_02355 [Candidatus Colwellbacteria bacterium]|nr:hypothetical protein [Candidatus Colwellbacteria bacterium]
MPDILLKKESADRHIYTGLTGTFFFFAALILFFFSLAGFGGLALLNRAQGATREEIQEQIRAKEENLRPELIQQITLLDQRLTNMRALLSRHFFVSNVFDLIESRTHPKTQFTNFSLSVETRRITLSGETASYLTLAQQIGLFEEDSRVEQVEFGGLSLSGTNHLGFRMVITFKDGLLYARP